MNERKPKGFYAHMSEQVFIDHVKANHQGTSIEQLRRNNYGVYIAAHRRKLTRHLVKEGVIVRERRFDQVKKMNDQEVIAFLSENHRGLTPSQLQEENVVLYNEINRRGLMVEAAQRGLLNYKGVVRGSLNELTPNEFKQYMIEHHKGQTITQIQKSHQAVKRALDTRGCEEELVHEGILVRMKRKHGFWREKDDEEIIAFVKDRYQGLTQKELSRKDGGAYDCVQTRGLIKRLVDEGILRREGKPRNFFKKMTDEELVKHIQDNYAGISLGELEKKDPSVYIIAGKRGLVQKLVDTQVLVRTVKRVGFYSKMTFDDVVDLILRNHSGKTVTQFATGESGAYNQARITGALEYCVAQGILIRIAKREAEAATRDIPGLLEAYVNGE